MDRGPCLFIEKFEWDPTSGNEKLCEPAGDPTQIPCHAWGYNFIGLDIWAGWDETNKHLLLAFQSIRVENIFIIYK